MMKHLLFLTLISIFIMETTAQKTITFPSKDGLTVTADLYEANPGYPYLLLFHQARYSRGEYKETAERFVKLGYNCLAVDLRSGDEVNFVKNKTAEAAKAKGLPTEYLDTRPDMQAAIEYAAHKSRKEIVVLGSSYSASMALLLAKENPQIRALIVFSPGEYFNKPTFLRDTIARLDIPIFAASSADEYPYLKELFAKVNPVNVTFFKPSKSKGVHGSSALWKKNPGSEEYWLSLLLFFDQIKE
jgi:dienelactone hydrolase